MTFLKITILVFSVFSIVSAQTVNLSGTVTNCSGEPLAGATVRLMARDISTTTDARGMYEISYTVAVRDVWKNQAPRFSLIDRDLKLFLTREAPISVDFYNLNGKLVQEFDFSTLAAGRHQLNLPALNKSGLYIMKLNMGGRHYSYRVLSSPTGALTMFQDNPQTLQNKNQQAKASAPVDSLEVSADGYKTAAIGVDELSSTVDVALLTEIQFENGGGICPVEEIKFVHFSVGSGDATLIVFPTGRMMMIDSGTEGKATDRIVPFLQRHGIDHLDYYVDTHPHNDHDGGRAPLEDAGILNSGTDAWNELDVWLDKFEYGDEFELEGSDWFIYNVRDTDIYGGDANPNSLSVRIEFNGFIYTGTGDEGPVSQTRFMEDHPDLVEAHVRFTAHHLWEAPSFLPSFVAAANSYLYVVSNDWLDDSEFISQVNKLNNAIQNNEREHEVAITGEVGHVIVRASGGQPDEWSYEYCDDYANCMIDNFP